MSTYDHHRDDPDEAAVRTRDDRGASLVEYALLVVLIAIACIVAVAYFGTETGDAFSRVGSSVRHT